MASDRLEPPTSTARPAVGKGGPIVATKLQPPPLLGNYLTRPRLSAQLGAGQEGAVRLVLVSASPGYGSPRCAGVRRQRHRRDGGQDDVAGAGIGRSCAGRTRPCPTG
jgi:hypothetical protein